MLLNILRLLNVILILGTIPGALLLLRSMVDKRKRDPKFFLVRLGLIFLLVSLVVHGFVFSHYLVNLIFDRETISKPMLLLVNLGNNTSLFIAIWLFYYVQQLDDES